MLSIHLPTDLTKGAQLSRHNYVSIFTLEEFQSLSNYMSISNISNTIPYHHIIDMDVNNSKPILNINMEHQIHVRDKQTNQTQANRYRNTESNTS